MVLDVGVFVFVLMMFCFATRLTLAKSRLEDEVSYWRMNEQGMRIIFC